MRVYLDACCLGRLTDDQTQRRIREEAEAVELVLGLVARGSVEWIASDALAEEIRRNPSVERRIESETLFAMASKTAEIDDQIAERAHELQSFGYGAFDALHLAAAEGAHVDVLLSTDDQFVRRASQGAGRPQVTVRNPLSWVREQRL
jgi:predicted nucleic acid-binding protein